MQGFHQFCYSTHMNKVEPFTHLEKVTFEEVDNFITEVHVAYPKSLRYAKKTIVLYQDSEWYKAFVPNDRLAKIQIDAHKHRTGPTSLVKSGDTLEDAANNYPKLNTTNNHVDHDCYKIIHGIHEFIINDGQLPFVVLRYNQSTGSLQSIDGIHRTVAWLAEPKGDGLMAYVAFE